MNTMLTKLFSPLYRFPAKGFTLNYFRTEHKKSHYNLDKQQGNIKTSYTTGKGISPGI